MDLHRRWLEPYPDGVLSVYLRFDPADNTRRGFEARCTDAIHEARTHVSSGLTPEALEQAVAHVRAYVAGVIEPPERSLVLFATPDRLLRALDTALLLPTLARFSTRACVAPLLLADAAEPPGIAVLVDDTQALLLGVRRNRVAATERVQDLVPARQHQGGWSQARYQRHREQHVAEHYRHVAAEIERLLQVTQVPWVVIGGHPEARAALERELAPAVRTRLAGAFNGQFHQPAETLEDLAYPVLAAAQERQDLDDIDAAATAGAKGGAAAVGWGPVLAALAERAVHVLFCPLEPDFAVASRDDAGTLSAVRVGQPSWSTGHPTTTAAELPFDAIHDAVLQGAALRALRGTAADRLRKLGGVVALLRHA